MVPALLSRICSRIVGHLNLFVWLTSFLPLLQASLSSSLARVHTTPCFSLTAGNQLEDVVGFTWIENIQIHGSYPLHQGIWSDLLFWNLFENLEASWNKRMYEERYYDALVWSDEAAKLDKWSKNPGCSTNSLIPWHTSEATTPIFRRVLTLASIIYLDSYVQGS